MLLQIAFDKLSTATDQFSRFVYSFPVHIRILIGIALLFVLIVLILFAVILGSRIYKNKLARRQSEIRKKYKPVFSQLLFEDDERLLTSDFFQLFDKSDLQQEHNHYFILEELIHLRQNFRGETGLRIELIFRKLHFHDHCIQMLKNRRWYVKAKSIRTLAMMNIHEAVPHLEKFIQSRNEILRMEARIALMKLNKDNLLSFLPLETAILTDWDMANIYNMLITLEAHSLPDFTQWFTVKNKSVIEFAVMMTGAFKQRHAIPALMELLFKSDDAVRKQIVIVIRKLEAYESEDKLIAAYGSSSMNVKIEILKTLEVIATQKSETLLQSILQTTQMDQSISLSAVKALQRSGNNGEKIIDHLFQKKDETLNAIITHALSKKI